MKKKSKVLLFALLFCFVMLMQIIFSNPVEAVSVEEYKSKINNIIAQWQNRSFNADVYSPSSTGWVHNSYYTCSGCGYGGWECLAFARYCQNQFYGSCDRCGDYAWLYSGSINSIADLRVGDVIRYRASNYNDHSIVIIDTYPDRNTVRLIDCNSNYDDHIVRVWEKSFAEVKNYLNAGTLHEGGTSHLLRKDGNNVTTLQDQTKEPKIAKILVNTKSTTSDSILVRVTVENREEASKVQMSIWRSGYGDNTISTKKTATWDSTSKTYQVRFYESDIKQGTDGVVCVKAWVTNKSGKKTSEKSIYDFAFAGKSDLGSFTARIVPKSNTKYCIGISGKNNGDALKLKTKNTSDATQLWRFEKKSDGFYRIINVSTDKSIDVNGGGGADTDDRLMQLWGYVSTADQMQFMLQSYNGGYRIVPVFTAEMRGIDIADGKMENNRAIKLYKTYDSKNAAQTFLFEKVATSLYLNKNATSMYVGDKETLNVTINSERVSNSSVTWKSSNTAVATVSSTGVITAKSVGKATITATTKDGTNITKKCNVTVQNVPVVQKTASVIYSTHIQNLDWQKEVSNGATSGTSHKALRLEGIKIRLNTNYSGSVLYSTHVQNLGWQDWVYNGNVSGTEHKALRLEGIKIKLMGEIADYYDIYYRVHVQNFGWLDWAKNGAEAGSAGYSYRLEAIEIKLVKKGYAAPGTTKTPFKQTYVAYETHVQNIGWQGVKRDGDTAGTTGKSYRLEGIKITLTNQKYTGGIEYRTHVQNLGWQNWVSNRAMSGTSGKSLRLEAIQIKLTGEMAKHYDVYYRVHAQNFGWMGWAKNGQSAGTTGYAYRLEGIQIKLVEKGERAPGSTANAFRQK